MIIKIHGTSGAGKTTAVNNLVELASFVEAIVPNGAKKPEAYRLKLPGLHHSVFVLGSYENTCGGMDGISEVQDQIDLIHKYADLGHVVYEGLLMSTYYGKLGEAVERYGRSHIWAFMDTPIDVAIDRVKQRRIAAGNLKPLNERNSRERMKPINALKARLIRNNQQVFDLDHTQDCGAQLLDWLQSSEYDNDDAG